MNFLMQVNNFCSKFKFLAQLTSRAIIGYVFILSGLNKFHHLDKVVSFFKSLGIPLAELHAPLVASLEVGCGALIVVGFLTHLASVPLIVIMAVAILTAKSGEVHDLNALVNMSEFLYIAILLWLMSEGPGPISLGWPFARKAKSKSKK